MEKRDHGLKVGKNRWPVEKRDRGLKVGKNRWPVEKIDRRLKVGKNRGENAGSKSKVQFGEEGVVLWKNNTNKKK